MKLPFGDQELVNIFFHVFFFARYQYNCTVITGQCTKYTKSTSKDTTGTGKIIYLDRFDVQCDGNDFMLSHQYRKNSGKNWYEFNCCGMENQNHLECNQVMTPTSWHPTNRRVEHLEKQNIQCPNNSIISSFKLKRATTEMIRYQLKCCPI